MKISERLLRPEDAASILGMSVFTVYRRAKTGTIRSVRIGRSVRIPESEIERLLRGETAAQNAN